MGTTMAKKNNEKEEKDVNKQKASKQIKSSTKREKVEKKSAPKRSKASTNGKSLVIVESPAKTKTIRKILGDDYIIEASYGHIRDFPPKVLGFDVSDDFKPTFDIIPEKKLVVKKLNDLAQICDRVYLASDPDREGEAIAWHVREVLDIPDEKVFRIEFNEITPKAITNAVERYRNIDQQKVKAQQTRQILDRLVGYKISPVLWEKLRNNRLSAGRVQSVALRMICERENLINAFIPEEYWTISADFDKEKKQYTAELTKYCGKKIDIKSKEESDKIVKYLENESRRFVVGKISKKGTTKKPQPPFITSTLQREASNKLSYGVSKTMQIAQKLYEGIDIGQDGAIGLITYMRTDSVRISDDARDAAKEYIVNKFGKEYYPEKANIYTKGNSKQVQDAHEAIRPTYIDKTPDSIKKYLTNEQYRLYKLIWERFTASQCSNAQVENTTVEINADDYTFKVGASKLIFDGFMKVYTDSEDKQEYLELPNFVEGEEQTLKKINPKQHFTQPPARYSEASLVKALEEYGIGRPSTYAPIISKIQTKGYVEKIDKALKPTILGKTVSEQLVNHFGKIVDYDFTAGMEAKLDEIAENKLIWTEVLKEFYEPFIETVNAAKQNMERIVIDSGKICPNCGKPLIIRTSRWGTQFLGCSGYPECKTMMPLNADTSEAQEHIVEEKCEECGGDMISKVGPYGPYIECTACKHRKSIQKTIGVKCPKCGGEVIVRKSKRGRIFYGCNKYPNCDFVSWDEPINEKCPECGSILVKKVTKKSEKHLCTNKECSYVKEIQND
jgi:DNA topoisomerase-1